MILGDAAQLAADHCPNKWTLDPALQLDRPTYAPASHTMAFTPQCSPAKKLTIFSTEYYQVIIATHLSTTEG